MAPLLLLVLFGGLCALLSFASSSRPKPTAGDHGHAKKKGGEEGICNEQREEERASLDDVDIDLGMVFSTFDHDGDGFITTSELEESFKRLGIAVLRAEAAAMVERVDANCDGLIDIDEFRELYNSIVMAAGGEEGGEAAEGGDGYREEENDLKEAFDVFDGNGDGLISAEELDAVLGSLGLRRRPDAADCRDMIRRVDSDGDGMVSFQEFKRMMVVRA